MIQKLTSWVALAQLTVGLAACAEPAAADAGAKVEKVEKPVSVPLEKVAEEPVPRYLVVTGSLIADQESRVAAGISGKVLRTGVERGDLVAAGALLVQIDARTAQLSKEEARARLGAAKAQKELADAECARAERLFSSGAIHQVDYERMTATCSARRFETSAVEAHEAMAEKSLVDASVRAPFAGLVVERHTAVGEWVQAGSPVATIVSIEPLRLALTVPESEMRAIQGGEEVAFEVTAFPEERFTGQIRYIGPSLRKESRDLVVEAIVPNKDRRLRPGMFAVARIKIGEDVLPRVSERALREANGSHRLFAVKDGRLEERIVQTGLKEGGKVAIVRGVKPGEEIAAEALPTLKDGVRIQ